jgi:hypothetical protein
MIDIRVMPSTSNRFVVINERHHPDWRARAQAEDIPIYPTNIVMMGIPIPANVDRVELRFEPFSSTRAAYVLRLPSVLIASSKGICAARPRDPNADGVSGRTAAVECHLRLCAFCVPC